MIKHLLPDETFLFLTGLIFSVLEQYNEKPGKNNWDEDAKAVEKVKNGNIDAYEILFNKYCKNIYRYCFYLLLKRNYPKKDAEDAMSEAFVKCLESIHTLRENRTFFKFLHKTAYHICINILKKPQSKPDDPEIDSIEIPDKTQNTEGELMKKEIWRIIHDALNFLAEKYRLAVINVHLMGYSYREAAEIMGCKEDDIKRWVHRGMIKLKNLETLESYWEQTR